MMRQRDVSFDRVADIYDATRGFAEGVVERVAVALEEELSNDSTVLEVGVGTGRIAAPLAERGIDVTGVDISVAMLAKAKAKGLKALLLADARALPFADGAFDHVVTVHVTHLISDWRLALAESGRVARSRYASIATERIECDAEELRRAYEELCAKAGFEVRHQGIREREIPDVIAPTKSLVVAESTEMVDAKKAMERYRSRTFSNQWDIPEDVHEGAMSELERMYDGVERLERKERISLLVWNAADLRDRALG